MVLDYVCCTCKVLQSFSGCGYGCVWHVGDCGVCVVGKISKDIRMGVCKGFVVVFSYLVWLVLGDSIPICL